MERGKFMFNITDNKGFSMTFKNGCTISVQFGIMNYCSNYSTRYGYDKLYETTNDSKDAEIAVWKADGTWITKDILPLECGDVKGYVEADEVAEIILKVKNY